MKILKIMTDRFISIGRHAMTIPSHRGFYQPDIRKLKEILNKDKNKATGKVFKSLIVLCMAVMTVFRSFGVTNVKAESYDETIENAIIAGTGSEDDPYIIDPALAPEFAEYLEMCGDVALAEAGIISGYSASTGIAVPDAFGTLLQGTAHYSPNGAIWVYSSGGQPSSYNGAVRFKHIEYVNYSNTYQIYMNLNLSKSLMNEYGDDIASFSFNAAVAYLQSHGVAGSLAVAIANVFGKSSVSLGFALAILLVEIGNWYTTTYPLQTAIINGHGIIEVNYLTAYNGSWYEYMSTEEWTGGTTGYEPISLYGSGNYYNR